MTTPPQGEHEQPERQPADDRLGARSDDEPNATRSAPAWELSRPGSGSEYGQPADASPRRSRTGLTAALIGGVLLLVAGAAALAFTLQATVLDRTSVERDVATQFQEREGVALELDCAQEMVVDEGATYECVGITDQGEELILEIAITDETDAAYTWGAP
jgi:hypothetical protein